MPTPPRHAETAWARPLVFAAAALSTALWAYACGDGASEPTTPTPDPPRATSVTVTPSTAQLAAPGSTVQLAAEVRDQNGNVMGGAPVSWSSSAAAVATVDGSGLVRGRDEGTATITATSGSAEGTATITVANPDRAALAALYNATDGPNWVDNTNWLTDAPLGEWYGVNMDGLGRVQGLDLRGRWDSEAREFVSHGLAGEIPPELSDLANLGSLALPGNELAGPIPPELGDLANLTVLSLDANALTGPIPPELGDLANLTRLGLSRNELAGPIPPELGDLTNLMILELWFNALTGPIPPELGDLANLTRLDLSGNELAGPIPPELSDLTNLTWLRFDSNALTGPIPPELGDLTNLTRLDLDANALTGPIPPELSDLANLMTLELRFNALTGPVPPELGDLANLTSLWLSGNALTGPIPPELGDLANLTLLELYDNPLEGALPLSLEGLPLSVFWYFSTNLCVPADESFRAWLNAIPNHRGTGVDCGGSTAPSGTARETPREEDLVRVVVPAAFPVGIASPTPPAGRRGR